jgi:steroid delta-isomerase-like uncharacterized protein
MTPEKREARRKVVNEHIRLESGHEVEALVQTFGLDPEWHNQAADEVLRGHEAIRGFYADLFEGFPDFWLDVRDQHLTEEAIIVAGLLGGTHTGTWMGIAPTARKLEASFCAVFTFTEDDRLKAEKVYYDRYSILVQLGVIPSP